MLKSKWFWIWKIIKFKVHVGKLLETWFNVRRGNNYWQCPHDPLTVYESIYGGN